ncbi:prepilin-type N-terminal cleavage/methylation domain-containing protein [Oceanospirillaceae bacterium]|nr:prepilin-type N-terminal cleavage/methylation domain-containing protein [Oceanospirillaceae bacterium]
MFLSKTQTNLKKGLQAGYSLIEILVVLGLIGLSLAIMFAAFGGAKDTVVVRQYTQEITSIRNAAVGWRGASPLYEGISMVKLTTESTLDKEWGITSQNAGKGVNPNGGDYSIAVGSPKTQYEVTVTGMPTQICGAVKRVFTDISVSGLCATASGIDTLTLKFIN